jgi:Putative Actinobacterial Holin-X, holin superfamily III
MDKGEAPGLAEQFGRLRAAAEHLVRAHLDLARVELSEIAGEIKQIVGLIGLALGFVFFALLLIFVGLPLFLGDFLFGSMGWGILHGVLFAAAVAAAAIAAALGAGGRAILVAFLSGVVVSVAIALALGSDIAFQGAAWLAARASEALRISPPAGWDTIVAGAIAGAVIGLVLFFLIGLVQWRSLRGALGLRVDGFVLGAFLGALCGAGHYTWPLAVANGLVIGLLVWVLGSVAAATSADVTARFSRLTPTTTIETAKETWEWVRARIKPATR